LRRAADRDRRATPGPDRRRPPRQPPTAQEDARGCDPAGPGLERPRADLAREAKPTWTASHLVKAADLVGTRREDARGSGLGALSRAAWGDFEALGDHEGRGLDDDARRAWARTKLLERIDAEVAGLEAHLKTLDFEMIEQDRAEAGDRALFDPSREAA